MDRPETKDSSKTTADQTLIPEDLEGAKRAEILRNKKNVTALILAFACDELRDIEDAAVQFLRNRLYNDRDIFQIFKILVRKKIRIKRALLGGGN